MRNQKEKQKKQTEPAQVPKLAAHHSNNPHPREFYEELIMTEKKIKKGFFAENDITLLIEMYTKCIEYFDSVLDPIKVYFEDKISSTLSNPSILKVLMNSSQENGYSESNICSQISPKNQDKTNQRLNSLSPSRSLFQQKKQERLMAQHKIDLFEEQKKSQMEKEMLMKHKEKIESDNKQLRQISINSQAKDIEERLHQRKKKNSTMQGLSPRNSEADKIKQVEGERRLLNVDHGQPKGYDENTSNILRKEPAQYFQSAQSLQFIIQNNPDDINNSRNRAKDGEGTHSVH